MWRMVIDRFKSPVVWVTVIAQLLTVMVTLELIDLGQSETINTAAAAILQVLVVFGVLNNPADKQGF